MWSKHDLLRFAGAEITGEDTMKRMWSLHDLLRLVGAEITDEDEDTMKRMWSRDELIDLLSNLDPIDPEDPSIPARYIQTTVEDFDSNGDYIGTAEYIILPADKPSGYNIQNINVKGVATNGDYLTDTSNMFRNNNSLYLELDYLNTSNVTNMSYMFQQSQATTLDLSSFDTSNVTNMSYMFDNSQATTGYARTQTDADNFNNSSNKPNALTFVVK